MLTDSETLAQAVELHRAGRLAEAEQMFERILHHNPEHFDALHLMGLIAHQSGRREQGIRYIRQALHLRPDAAEAHYNLAVALMEIGQVDEAIQQYRQALSLKPDYAEANNNLGSALLEQGEIDEALACFERAAALNPDLVSARLNRGILWLLSGKLSQGWSEYEWRWKSSNLGLPSRNEPPWDGTPLRGRTIALWSEQGLGDAIQFVRFAPLVKERGGRVVVICPSPLRELVASCPGVDAVVTDGNAHCSIDVQAPLLRLPGILGTTLDTIPATVPYLFPDPAHVVRWRQRLTSFHGFRIGIVWQGNPGHRGDRWRSLPLGEFAPLGLIPGVQLISLQKGHGSEQLVQCSAPWRPIDLGSELDPASLEDAAALLLNLDLVVTVDTAVAHLAGALAIPVWLALPLVPDWRWLLDRSESPWYPTMRLFRQTRRGEWKDVFHRIAEAMEELPGYRSRREAFRDSTGVIRRPQESTMANVSQSLSVAVEHHQAGRLEEAERLYQGILRSVPQHMDALHLLGLIALQRGQHDQAIELISSALRINPNFAELHFNLGSAFQGAGRLEQAALSYRQAARLNPSYAEAHNNLGVLLYEQGRLGEAMESYRQALQCKPQYAEACNNLGNALKQEGRLEEAADCYRKALGFRPQSVTAHHRLGQVLQRLGKWEEALNSYREAARLEPGAQTQCSIAKVLAEQGKWNEAAAAYRTALELAPDLADGHYGLAVALKRQGKPSEALASYQQALLLRPDMADAYLGQGVTLFDLGRPSEAEACFRQAIRLRPDMAEAHYNLGNWLVRAKNVEEGVACFHKATSLKPDFVEAYHNLADALQRLGKSDEAREALARVLQLNPNLPEAHNALGNLLLSLEKGEEAAASFTEAIRLKPAFAEAYTNLGLALAAQGKLDEAVAQHREAIRIRPDLAEAHNNLGNVLQEQGRFDEVLECYREACRIRPDYAELHNNLGVLLAHQGKVEEAVACTEEAIRLKPDYAGAHKNRGMHLLLAGNFAAGWPEYEWRWQCKEYPMPALNQPLWDGAPLEGRTIVVWSEQGLGDTIQFIRFAPLVKERGGKVIAFCQPALARLLTSCRGIDEVVPQGESVSPPVHLQAPLLSLPRILGTTVETIPVQVPYLFPSAGRVEAWRRRLEGYDTFKVGIVWQGNPKHKGDRLRSVRLTQFVPLGQLPGVQLFSLQKGAGSDQIADESSRNGVIDLAGLFDANSLEDAAAALLNLDLVITVDSALAHLAGALGAPVWVALPFAPDWRWLLDRSDSPWYPSLRLFRQRQPGDWAGVFQEMAAAVQPLAAQHGRRRPITVRVKAGELIDRIVGLEVEHARPRDGDDELDRLRQVGASVLGAVPAECLAELRSLHETLAEMKAALFNCEETSDFGPRFVESARSMARANAQRAVIQKRLTELFAAGDGDKES